MSQYILRRLLLFLPTLLLVTGVIFTTLRVIPGDVARLIVTGGGEGKFGKSRGDGTAGSICSAAEVKGLEGEEGAFSILNLELSTGNSTRAGVE